MTANQKEQPPVAPEASGPAALVERLRADAGQILFEMHPEAREHAVRDLLWAAADMIERLASASPAPAHRCSGCGHQWEGPLKGAELCGDCWRKGQAAIHVSPAPACASCAEKDEQLAKKDRALENLRYQNLVPYSAVVEQESRAKAAEALQQSQAQEIARLTSVLIRIHDEADDCACEHDDEDCCEVVPHNTVWCARCIAGVALKDRKDP